MYIPSQYFLNKLMTQLVDHAVAGPFSGVLDGCYLGLYITPTPGLVPASTLAAITEATFTGYARQALVWHTPYIDSAPAETIQAASLFFNPTDAVTPNIITGLFVADALTAGNLLFSEPMPGGPVPLPGPTTALGLALLFQLNYLGNYGDAVVIS